MKIFKNKSTTLHMWDFEQWLFNRPLVNGTRIGVSWKIGKRRKLRSYKVNWQGGYCDSCGHFTEITLTKGDKSVTMDNHRGSGHMEMF